MAQNVRQRAIEEHEQLLLSLEQRAGDEEQRRRWLSWLNRNYTFDHGLKLANENARRRAERLLETILTDGRQRVRDWAKKSRDIEILAANLLVGKRNRPLAISLNRNDYTPNRYTRAGYFTPELVTLLEKNGWLQQYKGSEVTGRMTRIWPTKKFLDYIIPYDQFEFDPVDLVELRDSDGKPIDYTDNRETIRLRNRIRKVNIFNVKAKVQIKTQHGFCTLDTKLHAIYNGSFKKGGRLYTGRDGYQSRSKDERSRLFINGIPTVELDFNGMQPRLLYAREGIQYPLDTDPYAAVIGQDTELRPFVKKLLLTSISAKTERQVVSVGNYMLYSDPDLHCLLKEFGISTAELVNRFKIAHPRIAHAFHDCVGLELMRLDAKIALDVLEELTDRGIPILAIHDSFLVQRDKKEVLWKAMQEAFSRNTGGFECPIKEETGA